MNWFTELIQMNAWQIKKSPVKKIYELKLCYKSLKIFLFIVCWKVHRAILFDMLIYCVIRKTSHWKPILLKLVFSVILIPQINVVSSFDLKYTNYTVYNVRNIYCWLKLFFHYNKSRNCKNRKFVSQNFVFCLVERFSLSELERILTWNIKRKRKDFHLTL